MPAALYNGSAILLRDQDGEAAESSKELPSLGCAFPRRGSSSGVSQTLCLSASDRRLLGEDALPLVALSGPTEADDNCP